MLDNILDLQQQVNQAHAEYMRLLHLRDKLIQQEIQTGTSMYRIAQHIGVNGETIRKIRDKKQPNDSKENTHD